MNDPFHDLARRPVRRRGFLAAAAPLFAPSFFAPSFFAWGFAPHAATAAGGRGEDQRLLVIVLRGGMDGLAAVPVPGDPAFAALRTGTPRQRQELEANQRPLGGLYALNGHLGTLHDLYGRGEALIVHAAATPSRNRSHFEAQDVLESGLPVTLGGSAPSGWLNRALAAAPRGPQLRPAPSGLAVAPTMPLIMRGRAPVLSWQPQTFQAADEDTIRRVHALYAGADDAMAEALLRGAEVDGVLGTGAGRFAQAPPGGAVVGESISAVVRLMARPDGPRVGTMSIDGWDTHVDQGFESGAAGRQMRLLDYAIATLRDGLAPVWESTVVMIVTEFGRTARINGSAGTDHGTATIALLLGGAVKGGRVVADWPGLAPAQLFEGRDLAPTTDLRAVFKGVLAEHVGVPLRAMDGEIFPDSAAARPILGLVRG